MSDPHALAERIIGHYERHAASWSADRARTPDLEAAWLNRVISHLPASGSTVLDLGCGPGSRVARHMIERDCRVTGVDSSQAMIARCKAAFPDHEWIEGDMRELRLGRQFACIIAWDSFFHLTPDALRRMFPIFRDHLTPGGILLFNTGPKASVAIGDYLGDPLYHASLDPAEYEKLSLTNGLNVISCNPEDASAGGRTVWLAIRHQDVTEHPPEQP